VLDHSECLSTDRDGSAAIAAGIASHVECHRAVSGSRASTGHRQPWGVGGGCPRARRRRRGHGDRAGAAAPV